MVGVGVDACTGIHLRPNSVFLSVCYYSFTFCCCYMVGPLLWGNLGDFDNEVPLSTRGGVGAEGWWQTRFQAQESVQVTRCRRWLF